MILTDKEKISALKMICFGHNWEVLGAPLCAYIFALRWCVTIGMPIQPGNVCIKSNPLYFKSKLKKLCPKIFIFDKNKILNLLTLS